jgi:uncharacterized protein YbbC (DUF1343 family)/CubicO group peptidase (beta-lactamase class C family)
MFRAAFASLMTATVALAAGDPGPAIDRAAEAAVAAKQVPSAVVAVAHDGRVTFERAYGRRSVAPTAEVMTPDTIFDMASLTKPVATATSVILLVERGKLKLSDPVAKYWPAFAANGKDTVTIEECLLHTTGLTADNDIKDYADGPAAAWANIAALKLQAPPGTRFRYSDVGFLTLGHVVELVSGQPLDKFAQENVFTPLKMSDTGFTPKPSDRVAPTGLRGGKVIRGTVHDPRAFALGGVAGHAGLFSTAADLSRFARMLLNGGELDGVRVLKPETVKLLTDPVAVPPKGKRSRGWDVDTGFSSPRGDRFTPGTGFGHTGFTGTSLWIDPPSKTAVVILTNRVHPDDKGNATPLRRAVANAVADAYLPPPTLRPCLAGIDGLRAEKFARLKGKRVALVTNHTGRAIDGTPTIDLLAAADGVKLVALFSPEHGIRGELDEKVGDSTDTKTGLPVYSLYGTRTRPTVEQLKDVDVIVYDIQDIGCRFYTYISTLGGVLESAAEANCPVLVLDRPNPLGGVSVAGPMRDPVKPVFVAYHDLPVQHGMTVGELARLFNAERKFNAKLDVVAVDGWHRADAHERTGLPWRNPSPNMRHLTAAFLYPGVGLLETTNVSVGRGTERPFEWVGAPWVDARKLQANLAARNLPGVAFGPETRTPTGSVHKGVPCTGLDIYVLDRAKLDAVTLGLHLAAALREVHPKEWNPKNFNRLLVNQSVYDAIVAGQSPAAALAPTLAGTAAFRERRQPFLIYPE